MRSVTIPLCATHFEVMGIVYSQGYVPYGELEAKKVMDS